MIRKKILQSGIIQIPVIIGLLIIGIALPAALKLTQDTQDTRNEATDSCSFARSGDRRCNGNNTAVEECKSVNGPIFEWVEITNCSRFSQVCVDAYCVYPTNTPTLGPPTSTPTIAYPVTLTPTITPTSTPTMTPSLRPTPTCILSTGCDNFSVANCCSGQHHYDSGCPSGYACGGPTEISPVPTVTPTSIPIPTSTRQPTATPTSGAHGFMCCDKAEGCIQPLWVENTTGDCPSGKVPCPACGGGRPDRSFVENPVIVNNPNNETDGDRFDLYLTVLANCAGVENDDFVDFLIGPDPDNLAVITGCTHISHEEGNHLFQCVARGGENVGARNSAGWVYEGGQVCVKVEHFGCSPQWSGVVCSDGIDPLPTPNPNCHANRSCSYDNWYTAFSTVGGFGRSTLSETNPSDINCDLKVDLIDFNLQQHGCLSAPGVPR